MAIQGVAQKVHLPTTLPLREMQPRAGECWIVWPLKLKWGCEIAERKWVLVKLIFWSFGFSERGECAPEIY